MVGATARRSALTVVVAVLALTCVSDGGPGHVATYDPSTYVAAVRAGPLAPVAGVRRQPSVGDWRLRVDPAGGSRAAAVLAIGWVLWLLGLDAGMAYRAPRPTPAALARRRHSIFLRAPPLPA